MSLTRTRPSLNGRMDRASPIGSDDVAVTAPSGRGDGRLCAQALAAQNTDAASKVYRRPIISRWSLKGSIILRDNAGGRQALMNGLGKLNAKSRALRTACG